MTTAVTKPPTQVEVQRREPSKSKVKDLFESPSTLQKIRDVLPKHLTPERLVKIALVQINRVPKLASCEPMSLLRCVMQAAELGLDFASALGLCYMVPFENRKAGTTDVQFIIGYRGLIALARRSGIIDSVEARIVYEGEEFALEYGIEPVLRHVPSLGKRGPIKAVYAIARMKDGGKHVEVMTIGEVEAIRGRSRAANNGPWQTDFAEMARKTVIRRLCKYLPLSPEEPLARGLENDDDYSAEIADVVVGKPTGAAAVNRLLASPDVEDEPAPGPEVVDPTEPDPADVAAQADEAFNRPSPAPAAEAPKPDPVELPKWFTDARAKVANDHNCTVEEAGEALDDFSRRVLGKPVLKLRGPEASAITKHVANGDIRWPIPNK